MIKALNTSATGMTAQEKNVDTIANNIANVNTTGFKQSRTEFQDLLYETKEISGAKSSDTTEYTVGNQVGSGVKVAGVRKDFRMGDPQITKNPYDLMIWGEGFFGIEMPSGEMRFTRDGSFSVDSTGTLTTKDGLKISPGIIVPPTTHHLNVTKDGIVEAFTEGKKEPTQLGQIPIFKFVNPAGMRSMGSNLLKETQGSGASIRTIASQEGSGHIEQGMLETSNVKIVTEMSDLIKAQRAYEMNSKVMGIADKMLQTVNNVR
jgi:flagellar basal-body rod protein FlgG